MTTEFICPPPVSRRLPDGPVVTLSARELGTLALPNFCPRCFWLKYRARELPYQIFPSIFAAIDGYTRGIVHRHLDWHRASPWFRALGEVTESLPVPGHARFQRTDHRSGVNLRGVMDAVFRLSDGSHLIVDFKTARYTRTQDRLFPMYAVQLNAYAYIAQAASDPQYRFTPVSRLALVYLEPAPDSAAREHSDHVTAAGFTMPFRGTVVPVPLDLARIPALMRDAREIASSRVAPPSFAWCKECYKLERLITLLQHGDSWA